MGATIVVVLVLSVALTAHGLGLIRKVDIPRRSFVATVLGTPFLANAQSDQQFGEVGQLQSTPSGEAPFRILSNGVQVKDFRVAGGGTPVQKGARVELT